MAAEAILEHRPLGLRGDASHMSRTLLLSSLSCSKADPKEDGQDCWTSKTRHWKEPPLAIRGAGFYPTSPGHPHLVCRALRGDAFQQLYKQGSSVLPSKFAEANKYANSLFSI